MAKTFRKYNLKNDHYNLKAYFHVESDRSTGVVNIRSSCYDVRIDRCSIFGNPFVVGRDGDRCEVIAKYKDYFYKRLAEDPEFRSKVQELKGKVLGCWCKPFQCHGDVIAEYLNKGLVKPA
ncbi:hypothetical protein ES708_14940 [subsurface metagenome]